MEAHLGTDDNGSEAKRRSQSDIDNVMKSFKEDVTSYNREQSKGESVSEFLGIDIKTLDDFGFKFYKLV